MSRPSLRRPIHIALLVVSVATIVWGALAFGAVYPWAYTPLAGAAAFVGVSALVLERRGRPKIGGLALGLIAIGVTVAVQLVSLPLAWLARVSPNTDVFLRQYDLSYGSAPLHPLSIAPNQTALGLALFMTLGLFLLGLSRLISATGASAIARPLVHFGVVLALVGIAQWTLTCADSYPLIYGFWQPKYPSRPFGPFVNPNHFAGWMVMGIPLGLAVFYDALLTAIRSAPGRGRDRMAVLSSPSMGICLFFGLSCLVMALSLFMTRSRSGIAAFALGGVLAGWMVFRKQKGRVAKIAVVAAFLLIGVGTIEWAGLDTIVGKFMDSDHGLTSASDRVGAWKDTVGIARRFPLAGTGLDTYGVAMEIYQTGERAKHFQEAHNDYLQLASEGGLLVGIPLLVTLALFIREIRRRFQEAPKDGSTYWLRVGAVIGLVSIAVQSLAEFSLQMPGNAALFVVLAAIAIHQSPRLRAAASASDHARPAAGG